MMFTSHGELEIGKSLSKLVDLDEPNIQVTDNCLWWLNFFALFLSAS